MLHDLLDFILRELSFEQDLNCTFEKFTFLVETFHKGPVLSNNKEFLLSVFESLIQIPLFDVLDREQNPITSLSNVKEIQMIKPNKQVKRDYLSEGINFSSLSESQWELVELIASRRENGITQVEISKELNFDSKTTFHLLKRIHELGLVVKYPYIFKSANTNLWFHNKYDSYFSDNADLSSLISSRLSFSSVTFEKIKDILMERPLKSIFIMDLARLLGIARRDYKGFRAKLSIYASKGLLEKFVSIYEDGKRMFCIKLLANNEDNPGNENSNNDEHQILSFCSTLEKDLIRLGMMNEGGMFTDVIMRSLILKKKSAEVILKLFSSSDQNSTLPFLQINESVGKEHRKKIILKPHFKNIELSNVYNWTGTTNINTIVYSDTSVIADSKTVRMNFLKEYIEKNPIIEKNFELHHDIQNLLSTKHQICRKTISKDIQELEEIGFCKIIKYEKKCFNGTIQKKQIIVHHLQDLDSPEVIEKIEEIKGKVFSTRSKRILQVEPCDSMGSIGNSSVKKLQISSTDNPTISEDSESIAEKLPRQTGLMSYYPSVRENEGHTYQSNFWKYRSKQYGFIVPEMQRVKLLHLYLWDRFNLIDNFLIFEDIAIGILPLKFYLQIIPIISDVPELLASVQNPDMDKLTLNDLSSEIRMKICSHKQRIKFFELVTVLANLHIIELISESRYRFCPQAYILCSTRNEINCESDNEIEEFMFEGEENSQNDDEICSKMNEEEKEQDTSSLSDPIDDRKLFNISTQNDIILYWSTLEYFCLQKKSSSNDEITNLNLLHPITSSDSFLPQTDKLFIGRIKRTTAWLDLFLRDESTLAYLNSFVDYKRGYTPYYNVKQLQIISETLNVPIPKIRNYFFQEEKKIKSSACQNEEEQEEIVPNIHFYHDDQTLPDVMSKCCTWTKKKDEILLIASTIIRDLTSSTPMKFLWKDVKKLFDDNVEANFFRHRCSLIYKYMQLKAKIVSFNWQSLKSELCKQDFFNPAKRSFSHVTLLQLLVLYEDKYGKSNVTTQASTIDVVSNDTVSWEGSLEDFLQEYSLVRLSKQSVDKLANNTRDKYALNPTCKKNVSDIIDEALSFRHVKYIMQTRKFTTPKILNVVVNETSSIVLECMDFVRMLLFNKTKSDIFLKVLQFPTEVIQVSVDNLSKLGTLTKIMKNFDVNSLFSYQLGEKVKNSLAKFEDLCKDFSNNLLPSIYGANSSEMRDDFLVDLLNSVTLKGKLIKSFGSNIIISNAVNETFSKFAPYLHTSKSIGDAQRCILDGGNAWKTNENELNYLLISTLQWILVSELSRKPGCTTELLFDAVCHLISMSDFELFLCFLQSRHLIVISDDCISLDFSQPTV